ncbi:MAG: hypothetical protein ACPGXK_05925 [Phycisphaerae bacterium]
MSKQRILLGFAGCLMAVFTASAGSADAAPVAVPNASFETPAAPPVSPFAIPAFFSSGADAWNQTPVPPWWPLTSVEWDQSLGVFLNVPGPLNITNADGDQLMFMFATPDLGVTQDLAATYEEGQAYELTVALRGGSGGMPLNSPIGVSLYYRDGGNNIVTIATTESLNDQASSPTSLIDVTVSIPPVQAGDAWAGQNIGIQIISTVGLDEPELQNGTWGVDNVRLEAFSGAAVPAASTWGLIAMVLAIMTSAKLLQLRNKQMHAV